MHELSITQSLLDLAVRHARAAQATRVTALTVVVGQLASLVDDSVQFYWDIVAQGTLCEGARLHFVRLPAEFACQQCGHRYPLAGALTTCPQCDSAEVRVVQGEELRLESLDIETT